MGIEPISFDPHSNILPLKYNYLKKIWNWSKERKKKTKPQGMSLYVIMVLKSIISLEKDWRGKRGIEPAAFSLTN